MFFVSLRGAGLIAVIWLDLIYGWFQTLSPGKCWHQAILECFQLRGKSPKSPGDCYRAPVCRGNKHPDQNRSFGISQRGCRGATTDVRLLPRQNEEGHLSLPLTSLS